MRKYKGSNENTLKTIVLQNLNSIFGTGNKSMKYYKLVIFPLFQSKFEITSLVDMTETVCYDKNISEYFSGQSKEIKGLLYTIDRFQLLSRIEAKTGIQVVGNK